MKDLEEKGLIERKLFTSKDIWKVITSVAVSVFVITLIYARFVYMEQDLANQKEVHAKDISTIKQQYKVEAENLREYFETRISVIDERQTKQHSRQDEDIKELQALSHERGK